MDEETCRHLFEPFWTTKPAGTGLGLATVYRIVEGHGGELHTQPRDGGGTVVTILLPIMEESHGENQNTGC
jgi:two-component system sensor histidine kinase PilS (NtrC family)